MKILITNKGKSLSIQLSENERLDQVEGIFIGPGDAGVQLLVQLEVEDVSIEADETTDIKSVVKDLLASLNNDEED